MASDFNFIKINLRITHAQIALFYKNDEYASNHAFDFSGSEQRYLQSYGSLDHFCIDETMGYFVLGWNDKNSLEDTPENRYFYHRSLQNHLIKLGIKKMDINIKK
ncbi:MAG: hypothetical protein ABJK28_10440 [Algibacter sp.]